jgi:hypothetical protein
MGAIPQETIDSLAGLIKDKVNDPSINAYIDSIAKALMDSQSGDAIGEDTLEEIKRLLTHCGELEKENARLARRNAFLSDKNAMLSAALGACVCWGENAACPNCRGRGRPGFYSLNVDMLRELFAPLAKKKDQGLRDLFGSLAGREPAKTAAEPKEPV